MATPRQRTAFCTLNRSPIVDAAVDPAEQVRVGADTGFDAVSLDIFSLRAARHHDRLRGLRLSLAESGLAVLDLSALLVGIGPEADRAALDEVAAFADELGPEWVLVKVQGQPGDPVDGAVVDAIGQATRRLATSGVRLAIEPSPFSAAFDLAGTDALLDAVGEPAMGIVVDAWHLFLGGDRKNLPDSITANRVAYVQMSDGVRPDGPLAVTHTMHDRRLPGEGDLDLLGLRDAVVDLGWTGTWCEEVLGRDLRHMPLDEDLGRRWAAMAPFRVDR